MPSKKNFFSRVWGSVESFGTQIGLAVAGISVTVFLFVTFVTRTDAANAGATLRNDIDGNHAEILSLKEDVSQTREDVAWIRGFLERPPKRK